MNKITLLNFDCMRMLHRNAWMHSKAALGQAQTDFGALIRLVAWSLVPSRADVRSLIPLVRRGLEDRRRPNGRSIKLMVAKFTGPTAPIHYAAKNFLDQSSEVPQNPNAVSQVQQLGQTARDPLSGTFVATT